MRSSELTGGQAMLGELRHMPLGTARPLMAMGAQEWLRTGVLASYSAAKYAKLLALHPLMGVAYIDAVQASVAAAPTADDIDQNQVFVHGGKYVHITAKSGQFCHTSAAPGTVMTAQNMASAAGNGVGCAFKIGPNMLAIAGLGAGSFSAIWTVDAAFTVTQRYIDGAWQQLLNCGAANADGSIAVAYFPNAAIGSQSGLVSTNGGVNWALFNATGGAALSIGDAGIHWSPCAAAFLCVAGTSAGGAIKKAANGYTFTDVALPAGVVVNAVGKHRRRQYASSATATLLSCFESSKLLRTTDGVNFAVIDLASLNLPGVGVSAGLNYYIEHDGTRFILQAEATEVPGAAPIYLVSADDGLTWAPCNYPVQKAVGGTLARVRAFPDGKHAMLVYNGTTIASPLINNFDATGALVGAPTHVGVPRAVAVPNVAGSVKPSPYVRIK